MSSEPGSLEVYQMRRGIQPTCTRESAANTQEETSTDRTTKGDELNYGAVSLGLRWVS